MLCQSSHSAGTNYTRFRGPAMGGADLASYIIVLHSHWEPYITVLYLYRKQHHRYCIHYASHIIVLYSYLGVHKLTEPPRNCLKFHSWQSTAPGSMQLSGCCCCSLQSPSHFLTQFTSVMGGGGQLKVHMAPHVVMVNHFLSQQTRTITMDCSQPW